MFCLYFICVNSTSLFDEGISRQYCIASSGFPEREQAFIIALKSLASSILLNIFIRNISPTNSFVFIFGFLNKIAVVRFFISSEFNSIKLLYFPFSGVNPVSLNNSKTPFIFPVTSGIYGFEEYSKTLFTGLVEG